MREAAFGRLIHEGGAASAAPPLWIPSWMAVWRLGRQGGNLTVVIKIPTMVIHITTLAIENTAKSANLD